MNTKKIVRLSMLLTLSIILNLLESLFPLLNGMIPGLKLGLANIVILITLYQFGFKEAFLISILRVFLVGILRTGLFNLPFFFSLGGALFSIVLSSLAKKTKLSTIGVSIIGSISHSIGQLIIAYFFVSKNMIYYTPFLLLFAIPTGILVGYFSKEIVKSRIFIES